jgi:hypothetical protein
VARKTMIVSDLSGEAIEEGKGAKVGINFNDARRGAAELDVTDRGAEELASKGRKTARRGRRPRSETAASQRSGPSRSISAGVP